MIITCPKCEKQFKISSSQIPTKGRNLQCGSCSYIWFYKIEDKSSEILTLKDDLTINQVETKKFKKDIKTESKNEELELINKSTEIEKTLIETNKNKNRNKNILKNKINKKNSGSKIVSYLIVYIITFVALILMIDTLKKPLINIFPGIEIILFNLFETLKDIKLFIIDLF